MRPSSLAWALALAFASLPSTTALNGAITRKLSDLADMGLLPDGTPMTLQSITSELESMGIASVSFAAPPTVPEITPVAEYVELPLDNFARTEGFKYYGMFNNRYWVRETAYRPGGPVFVYDAGEQDAEPGAKNRLIGETSFFKELVDRYNGLGIVWEHRYCMCCVSLFPSLSLRQKTKFSSPFHFQSHGIFLVLIIVDRWQLNPRTNKHKYTPRSLHPPHNRPIPRRRRPLRAPILSEKYQL